MLLKQIHIILVIILFSNVITTPVTNSTEIKHTELPPTQHVTPFSVVKILPYLNDCDTPRKPETQILCLNFYDMQERLNISKIEFNQSVVYDVLNANDTGAAEVFCPELEKILPEKLATANNVDNPLNKFACTKYCIDLKNVVSPTLKFDKTIKPICKVIYWGYQLLSAHAESPILAPKIETAIPNNYNSSKNNKKVITTAKSIELSSKTPVISKSSTQNPEMYKETATKQGAIISQKNAPTLKTTEQNNNTKAEEDVKSIVIQQQLPDKSDDEVASDIVMSQESIKTAPHFPNVDNTDMIDDVNLAGSDDDYGEGDTQKIPNEQTKENPEVVADSETKVEEQHLNSLDKFVDDPGSNFFSYFLFAMFASILLYVAYHNKTKVLALLLEGRRSHGGRNGSRRKHTAAYRKLDTNLEEAITSTPSGRSTQIIY